MSKPTIFLTNDDGIQSPGLRAAVTAVSDLARLVVVAPSRQQTGMGRSLKATPDMRIEPFDFGLEDSDILACHCDCTPAMTVLHGLNVFFPEDKPDLVISGINYGENLGRSITASGTVGAAMEAADAGIPALAISKQMDPAHYHVYSDQDWQASAHFLRRFAEMVLNSGLPGDVDLLKIDVPEYAEETTSWRLTRLSEAPYWITAIPNPSMESVFKDTTLTINNDPEKLDPNSDVYAVAVDHVVSVTPLTLDFTARTDFDLIRRNLTAGRAN